MKFQEDSHYIEKVLNGDTSAYASLVAKHKNLVFSIALKILNSREDAEEIAQDAFLKAYQSLKSFENKSKFSTWLYRIAYNASISKSRKKKMEAVPMDDFVISNYSTDEIASNVNRLDENDQMQLIEKTMNLLPEQDYLLINLFYKAQNSIVDISDITGLSQSNVKVRLHRIRKKMYDHIQEMVKND
jgi:RNA polymerase sigma-70 factor (ECF subfamily)